MQILWMIRRNVIKFKMLFELFKNENKFKVLNIIQHSILLSILC